MATTITHDYGSDYENPAATIFYGMNDYGNEASDYRLCPLKAGCPPMPTFYNIDPAPDVSGLLRGGVVKVRADGEPPRVEYIGGTCNGPRCAWWDADKSRCAVLSLARNK